MERDLHYCFGYIGGGKYACSCGEVLSSSGLLKSEQEPAVLSLHDQWDAHKREARNAVH